MIQIYLLSALLLVVAYLLGSIPNAVWIGKRYYGIDVREHGSKNAGSTNVLRVLGRKAALPVFALDILKGFVAVILTKTLFYLPQASDVWVINMGIIAVFVAVLGHIFPIFAQFKGGKGVATLVGAIIGVNAPVVLLSFGVWLIVFAICHYVSVASMVAGVSFPIFALTVPGASDSIPFVVFAFVVTVLLVLTHRKNIVRLKEGTETKIYIFRSAPQKE